MYFYFYSAFLIFDFPIFTLSSFISLHAPCFSMCTLYFIVLIRAYDFQLQSENFMKSSPGFSFRCKCDPSMRSISCLARLRIHVMSSRISILWPCLLSFPWFSHEFFFVIMRRHSQRKGNSVHLSPLADQLRIHISSSPIFSARALFVVSIHTSCFIQCRQVNSLNKTSVT